MNILLIDFNGKIPNLALMKLSTWYRKQGHNVFLNNCGRPDKVYISTLFTWDRQKVERLREIYPGAEIGGTGWDIEKNLPDEIENCKPDYDLYHLYDIAKRIRGARRRESTLDKARTIVNAGIGFTSRGCIRQCPFCVVPVKEGKLRKVNEIKNLINPRSNVLILLDNNITADPDVLEKLKEIKERDLIVDITQGIDVRLLTPEIAKALSEVRHLRSIHYAWDLVDCLNDLKIINGINLLKKFIKPWKHMCFTLTGYNTTFEQDMYRFRALREMGVDPYIMPYNKTYPTVKHHHFARWVNGRIYKACDFEEYEPWVREREKPDYITLEQFGGQYG